MMPKLKTILYHLICLTLIVFSSVTVAGAGEGYFSDEPSEYAGQDVDQAIPDTTEVSIKRLIVGGWGTVLMALIGFTGLFLLLYSGGGDGGGRSQRSSEANLLYGSICMVITLILFLYRLGVWWNRASGRDTSF